MTTLDFFLILFLIAAAILIVGFLFERRKLKKKALEASDIFKIIGGSKMANYGPFSPIVTLSRVEPLLPAPTLVSHVQDPGDPSREITAWALPSADKNGNPITAMSALHVYAQAKGIVGELVALLGMEPNAVVPITPAQAGQTVNVIVGGLGFGDYDLTARIQE